MSTAASLPRPVLGNWARVQALPRSPIANEPGWRWHGDGADMTKRARMAEPFPVVRTLDQRIAALGEVPDEDDFANEDAFYQAHDRWQEMVYELLDDLGPDGRRDLPVPLRMFRP
jgi:hypothetical protein